MVKALKVLIIAILGSIPTPGTFLLKSDLFSFRCFNLLLSDSVIARGEGPDSKIASTARHI